MDKIDSGILGRSAGLFLDELNSSGCRGRGVGDSIYFFFCLIRNSIPNDFVELTIHKIHLSSFLNEIYGYIHQRLKTVQSSTADFTRIVQSISECPRLTPSV